MKIKSDLVCKCVRVYVEIVFIFSQIELDLADTKGTSGTYFNWNFYRALLYEVNSSWTRMEGTILFFTLYE